MTIRAVTIAAALVALANVGAPPASAEVYRPWCVHYFGRGGTNCGFNSYDQCMETARGAGAYCNPNPWYLQYGGEVPSDEVPRVEVPPKAKVSKADRPSAKPRQTSREPARARQTGEPVFR
jgi:Protein of unknown function (DUF3551)